MPKLDTYSRADHPARVDSQTTIGGHCPGISVSAIVRVVGDDSPYIAHAGEIRRAYITGPADTWFSMPARASIGGRKVAGYITVQTLDGFDTATPEDPAVFCFIPYNR